MNIGDIVVVIHTASLPDQFLGHYGKIVDVHEYKVTVEFAQKVGFIGSLSHTAHRSDLVRVGESFE